MNLRWYVGSTLNSVLNAVLSSQAFPLTRYFPRSISVFYDIQRFSQKKDLKILLMIKFTKPSKIKSYSI
jgi:hypothetical protein